MSDVRLTPILTASLNILGLPSPHTTTELWTHAEKKALSHCAYCQAKGFSPVEALAPFGSDAGITTWDSAAEAITISLVALHSQLDPWLAGGMS